MRKILFACILVWGVVVSAQAQSIVGSWQCIEYTRAGESITQMVEQGKLRLNEDGTYVQTLSIGVQETGRYEVENTTIKLFQYDRVKMSGVIEAGKITLDFAPTKTRIVYQQVSQLQ